MDCSKRDSKAGKVFFWQKKQFEAGLQENCAGRNFTGRRNPSLSEKENRLGILFDQQKEEYIRKDGITDFIWQECRLKYGPKIAKKDIFYYVYGLLHSLDYRRWFSADLKKACLKCLL